MKSDNYLATAPMFTGCPSWLRVLRVVSWFRTGLFPRGHSAAYVRKMLVGARQMPVETWRLMVAGLARVNGSQAAAVINELLRDLGFACHRISDRVRKPWQEETLEATFATSRLFAAVAEAHADGFVSEDEAQLIRELTAAAQQEISDLAPVVGEAA